MNELPIFNETTEASSVNLKRILSKLISFWHWFLFAIVIALIVSFLRLRYQPTVYSSHAKIKILDDQEASGLSVNVSSIFKRSNISLNNEIPVFSSFRLVNKVVEKLALNVKYFKVGRVGVREFFNPPFEVAFKNNIDSLRKKLEYEIKFISEGYQIKNLDTEETITTSSFSYQGTSLSFPIKIEYTDTNATKYHKDEVFTFVINPIGKTTKDLTKNILIEPIGDDTDLLKISLDYINGNQARKIINTLISVYEADGINDRKTLPD